MRYRSMHQRCFLQCGWLVGLSATLASVSMAADAPSAADLTPRHVRLAVSATANFDLQAHLIDAVAGDVIELEAGRYELTSQIDIAASHVTLRGAGSDKTILSFANQIEGTYGLEATGDNLVLEGFAVEDSVGNAIKVLGARNVTLRDVRAEWTGPPSMANGAYGIYPVQCENVLIENCTAIGASDAGIYVGQCRGAVIRRSRAERNVAGIEIENTVGADVYDNVATNNAGGILVFDLPGLQLKAGRQVRVFNNHVYENNHPNFADPGGIVASVPAGTGMMILATSHVELFGNRVRDNQTTGLAIISYLTTGKKISDPTYNPIPDFISVRNNAWSNNGYQPQGELAEMLSPFLGDLLPDILWDGIVAPDRPGPSLSLIDNGEVTFANFKLDQLSPEALIRRTYQPERTLEPYQTQLAMLPATQLQPHQPPATAPPSAAVVYRSLPKKLSEYGLFTGPLREHRPAERVMLYGLNTQLFSDDSLKLRFIQLPAGKQIEYAEHGSLDFPVGTVISKTFYYPTDFRTPERDWQLMETRIELRQADGWYGATYLWDADQQDATLALGGGSRLVSWVDAAGQEQQLEYLIPNANQCLACHAQDRAFVPLGPTALNLNRHLLTPPGTEADESSSNRSAHRQATDNQLAEMLDRGWLSGAPPLETLARLPSFDAPQGGDGDLAMGHPTSVADRARAWLDVNCAHCHNPFGSARTSGLDLSWDQSDLARLGVWKSPVAAGPAAGGRLYDIVPGEPDASILMYRLESQEPAIRMPSSGRQRIYHPAVDVVRQWIIELAAEAAEAPGEAAKGDLSAIEHR
jgi:parallel beta-helix repeat protein